MINRPILSLKKKASKDSRPKQQATVIKPQKVSKNSKAKQKLIVAIKPQKANKQAIPDAKVREHNEKVRLEIIKKAEKALEILKELDPPTPFAIGMWEHLKDMFYTQGISKKAAKQAMRKFTKSEAYLRALLDGTHRYNLDGSIGGEVTEEHKQLAQQSLDKLDKKKAKL